MDPTTVGKEERWKEGRILVRFWLNIKLVPQNYRLRRYRLRRAAAGLYKPPAAMAR